MAKLHVTISGRPFDPATIEQRQRKALGEKGAVVGAQVSFVGLVRGKDESGATIDSLALEHYPGMTEKKLIEVAEQADKDHELLGIELHHRHGTLFPGDVIVVVSVASAHRKEAFAACREIVERLKTDVPFWKKETGTFGERWIESIQQDKG